MNRSRLDMKTASARTPTITPTFRFDWSAAGLLIPARPAPSAGLASPTCPREFAEVRFDSLMRHALLGQSGIWTQPNRPSAVRPVFGPTCYARTYGCRVRAAAGVLR